MVVTMWGTGHAISISHNISYHASLIADRFAHSGAVFIPVTWLHFAFIVSGRAKQFRKLIQTSYWVCVLTSVSTLTPWFIAGEEPAMGFTYYTRPGPLYHIYVTMFVVFVPIGFVELSKLMKRVGGQERTEVKGLFIATLFGFVGGSFAFFPVYGLQIPQYGYFITPFYPFVMAYFMIRHRLFDVEQAVQAFQREKLATIGLIASSINHEIKNPLYIVKGVLESYLENKKEGLPVKDAEEVTEKALKNVTRALDVITKLNRFARPTQEQGPATKAPAGPPTPFGGSVEHRANIQEALQNVLDLIQYEFELDKIHIENRLPQDLPPIHCDPRQLEEILFNLIVNACHAMSKNKEGGTLTISVQRPAHDMSFPRKRPACRTGRESTGSGSPTKAFGDDRETGKVSIEIADTGTGIPPEQLKHLFEPFYTTKGDKGTGLGLYITKQLIERNGGRITVKSKEGKGSAFVLEFKGWRVVS